MSADYFNVPLYQHLAKYIEGFFDKGDPGTIPLLRKQDIVAGFPENFMTDALRLGIKAAGVEFATTSGSSQTLQIIRHKGWWAREFECAYQWVDDLAGYSIEHDKKAVLTTAACSAASCFLDNPDYQERIHNGVLSLNTHLDPTCWTVTDIKRIDSELRSFAPGLLEVDPTYLAIFLAKRAEYNLEEALYIPRYIVASYEFMTANVRRLIENTYRRPVLSMYGSTELGVLFMQNCAGTFVRCGHKTVIELKPYLPLRNIVELVVTSWKNPLMPLLRYATGDLVEVAGGDCSGYLYEAAQDIPLLKLHGRVKDVIITAEGDIKTIADIDDLLSDSAPWVRQYQLSIAEASVTLFYVLDLSSDKVDMTAVQYSLRRWFGSQRLVELRVVPSIAPELSGKFVIVKESF